MAITHQDPTAVCKALYDKYKGEITGSFLNDLWQILVNNSITLGAFTTHPKGKETEVRVAIPNDGGGYVRCNFRISHRESSNRVDAIIEDLNKQVFGLTPDGALDVLSESHRLQWDKCLKIYSDVNAPEGVDIRPHDKPASLVVVLNEEQQNHIKRRANLIGTESLHSLKECFDPPSVWSDHVPTSVLGDKEKMVESMMEGGFLGMSKTYLHASKEGFWFSAYTLCNREVVTPFIAYEQLNMGQEIFAVKGCSPQGELINKDLVRFESILEDIGIDPSDIDEMVCDLFYSRAVEKANQYPEGKADGFIAHAEIDASRINNSGLKGQLEFLTSCGVTQQELIQHLGERLSELLHDREITMGDPGHDSSYNCAFTGTLEEVNGSYIIIRDMEDSYFDVDLEEIDSVEPLAPSPRMSHH